MLSNIFRKMPVMYQAPRYNFSTGGAVFLKMVENYFDRAALHTGIRADRLSFYKKAENVLKCSIPLIRGTSC